MHFFTAIIGLLLVAALSESAVVQRRIYRNTEEVLVPVTVIQDGEGIKEVKNLNVVVQPEIKNADTQTIAEDIAKAVDEEQKLEAVEAVVEAQRRFDEAIVEEDIKDVVDEENKELLNTVNEEEKIEQELIKIEKNEQNIEHQLKSDTEIPKEVEIQAEIAKPETETLVKLEEPSEEIKSVLVDKETPNQVVVVVETSNDEQSEDALRQATQATPSQTTTQQNFIQQFLQNLPGAQIFNQITGQQAQVANDEGAPANPTIPGFLNPLTNAAQSAVNATTQALQGVQQFASNLGNQFQNTLSSLTGQQQFGANDATTVRPPGPIQQFVNTIMGQQQAQPAPGQQQGPLQGLLNIFQGNNRPQGAAAANSNPAPLPAKEPEIIEQANDSPEEASIHVADNVDNEVRNSAEVNDSFEQSVHPEEIIIVNDDEKETGNEQERSNVPK